MGVNVHMEDFVKTLNQVWSKFAKPIGAVGLTAFGIEKFFEYIVPFLSTIAENVL